MSAKRRPVTDLNHENWDEDDDSEENNTEFKKASAEELKQRTIKKAKRRTMGAGIGGSGDNNSTATDATDASKSTSVFSSFTGFGKSDTKPIGSAFSFLSSVPSTLSSTTTTTTTVTKPTNTPLSQFSFQSKPPNGQTVPSATSTPSPTSSSAEGGGGNKSSTYYAKLKGLNQSISAWISKHVNENSLCILTPIFNDYAKYLKEIESSETNKEITTTEPIKTTNLTFSSAGSLKTNDMKSSNQDTNKTTTTTASTTSMFSFGKTANTNTKSPTTEQPPAATAAKSGFFSFSSSTSSSNTTAATTTTTTSTISSSISFGGGGGGGNSVKSPLSGFSFGGGSSLGTKIGGTASGSTPFSFSNTNKPGFGSGNSSGAGPSTSSGSGSGGAGADEENEEPPKNEFTPVVEDDSLYSKRCKVFVKKPGGDGQQYVDRGIGTLYIKSVDNDTKTQLVVRAETNLGNVILNILLTDAVPASRMGKNNVMMICTPTPADAKLPPCTVLVRVKNDTEADELLSEIKKHRKITSAE